MVRQAFHLATTGRPGLVLLDVPKDIVDPKNPRSQMEWYWPSDDEVAASLPGYRPTTKGHPKMIRQAAELILAARRPVIYAGGGILKARAAEALRELAELCDIHVVTTLMARAPSSTTIRSPRHAGHARQLHGRHVDAAERPAHRAGSRFDDRVTGKVDGFAPDAKVIHVDIDPAELGKVRRPDVPIVGDCRLVIEELVRAVRDLLDGGASFPDRLAWKQTMSGWQETYPLTYQQSEPGEASSPSSCSSGCGRPPPTTRSSPRAWASTRCGPRSTGSSTTLHLGQLGRAGHHGFSVPAAIGAKVGRPDRMVWAVDGDGCFQMTAQELVTATSERIPIKVAILNNAYLGMVRQWQEMFYDERYSEVYLSPDLPDYKLWAEAMGCVGMRVESPEEVDAAIQKANEIDDRPVVIDFRTDAREKVYPMVPSANDQIVTDPSRAREGAMAPGTDARHHTLVVVENKAGVLAAGPACSPGGGSTSSPWRWPPPRTSASAASPSWSTSSRRRWSRSPSSSTS